MKYKVMSDTSAQFDGIEIDYVIDDFTIGRELKFLGEDYVLQQNGKILVLANKDRVITIMDITPPKKEEIPKLEVNKTFEIFFDTKEILVSVDCTYEELFRAVEAEWKLAGALMSQPLPLDYTERYQLLTFLDDWKFADGSLKHMKNGSFARKNQAGRNI
jgi:hypothetical protein